MATLLSILGSLPTLYKFWGEFKVLFSKLKEMKSDYDRKKFLSNLVKASKKADSVGDTSLYEDIISRGR